MEKKLAVYICTGCGIGDALDIDQLSELATSELSVPICKVHANLCSKEGAQLIRDDMANEGANTLVIAACSPRVMYDVFNFEGTIIERVNLREQVAWSQPPKAEDTQMMAEDYLRMGVTKASKMELPEPYKPEEELSRDILVVGGGLTGMTASLEAAKAGYSVVLVEKQAELGGYQKKVGKKVTFPYKEVQTNDIDQIIQAVQQNDKIKVYTGAKVESLTGGPCVFNATISQNGSKMEHRIGAVVQAAGWEPYDPTKLDAKLGYGASPNVITNVQFEEISLSGKITRPSDQKMVKNVAFLQCAGQRDPNHLPYCSSVCCFTALKQAIEVKQQDPSSNVYVIYKELRTPGQGEDFYRKAQEEGVIFVRSQDPEVLVSNGDVSVQAFDELLGDTIVIGDLDLVVLATGMVPRTAFGEDVKAKEKKEGEPEVETPQDAILASDILNLQYRQGPELPGLKYGFPDSHFICFPYESRRTGIYPAGPVRRPMGVANSIEDATGAALKAIQCIELTSRGLAVHPRVGDASFPEFFMQRCTQCKRCTEECPFGAINEDEKGNPLPQPTRCRRCGVCMGACPERIISFKNYSVGMIGDTIKSINVPEEYDEKPRILVLACENDAYAALDMVGLRRMTYNAWVRVIPVRCLGSMNLVWVADSLSKGIDGVLLLGCQHGENYQCHFIKGSELANIRLSKVKETLDRLVLESDRVRFEAVAITDYDKLPALLDSFAEKLNEIGPNPYKGY
ncbi:FAD-dependent oxidoreductase [Desulforhabdus amnigena]|jgi:quinone-modifying oxidoreductase subunit QmoB|uniref:Heterodisulfide reductase subunit A n=1 Tax=Desulforhabdus amnigena TaxID=40218 RepID=A0A9W6CZY9_9BACT|nr:FAD-dependent oxidoreductase [Desulforhabdus amnigena]NLJ28435.1 hydrogenase iron-sulfur subunit [Deltaproteobacteria bacterium]GLI33457.1 heterodisulfide reductase subunit A [Desulforhabdus amnigena]